MKLARGRVNILAHVEDSHDRECEDWRAAAKAAQGTAAMLKKILEELEE